MNSPRTKPHTEVQAVTECNKLLRALNRPQLVERTPKGCQLLAKIKLGNGMTKKVRGVT